MVRPTRWSENAPAATMAAESILVWGRESFARAAHAAELADAGLEDAGPETAGVPGSCAEAVQASSTALTTHRKAQQPSDFIRFLHGAN
jgi:hypothetical protein